VRSGRVFSAPSSYDPSASSLMTYEKRGISPPKHVRKPRNNTRIRIGRNSVPQTLHGLKWKSSSSATGRGQSSYRTQQFSKFIGIFTDNEPGCGKNLLHSNSGHVVATSEGCFRISPVATYARLSTGRMTCNGKPWNVHAVQETNAYYEKTFGRANGHKKRRHGRAKARNRLGKNWVVRSDPCHPPTANRGISEEYTP